MSLSLEIVSARGIEYSAEGLDRVVVRRREPDHVPGSEIAICPHHAPLLMQIEGCRMRLSSGDRTVERDVSPGVLEVLDDHITLALT